MTRRKYYLQSLTTDRKNTYTTLTTIFQVNPDDQVSRLPPAFAMVMCLYNFLKMGSRKKHIKQKKLSGATTTKPNKPSSLPDQTKPNYQAVRTKPKSNCKIDRIEQNLFPISSFYQQNVLPVIQPTASTKRNKLAATKSKM